MGVAIIHKYGSGNNTQVWEWVETEPSVRLATSIYDTLMKNCFKDWGQPSINQCKPNGIPLSY